MDIATGIMPAEYVYISMDMHYTVHHAASVTVGWKTCAEYPSKWDFVDSSFFFFCSDEILGSVTATSPPRGMDEPKYKSKIQKDLI